MPPAPRRSSPQPLDSSQIDTDGSQSAPTTKLSRNRSMASCVECYRRKQKASLARISTVLTSKGTSPLIHSYRVGSVIANGPATIALTGKSATSVSSTSQKTPRVPAGEPRWLGKQIIRLLSTRCKSSERIIGLKFVHASDQLIG